MRGTEYDPLRFLRIFAFSFGFLLLFSSSFYLSLPSFYISLLFSFFLRSFLLFFSLTHTLHSRLEPVNVTTWFWNVLLTSSLLLNERTNERTHDSPRFYFSSQWPSCLGRLRSYFPSDLCHTWVFRGFLVFLSQYGSQKQKQKPYSANTDFTWLSRIPILRVCNSVEEEFGSD